MKEKPHLAILPSPGLGHIIPMVEFAKRLTLQHNLSTTLIVPVSKYNSRKEKELLEELPDGMNYILLPNPNLESLNANPEEVIVATIGESLPPIREAIKSLMASKNLVSLVVDFLGLSAIDIACQFCISPYIFIPSNAMFLSLFLYFPELDAKASYGQYRNLSERVRIPGCRVPLHLEDLAVSFHDRQHPAYQWFLHQVKWFRMAEGIILNSFKEMEAGSIKALQENVFQNPPIYPVGPLIRTHSIDSSAAEEYTADNVLIKWLDDQPVGSILFICFGSLGSLSPAQIQELAFGIEMSGIQFLWVVGNSNHPASSFLQESFVERTKKRGLVASEWAPQARILSHRSIGGFVTHCGWNSILESVVNGVPMIAWPLAAEQKMNAALLSEDLKVALRLKPKKEDGLVGRFCVADAVKSLMEGEEGNLLRVRTGNLKKLAVQVLSKDGSSNKSMAELASKLTNKTFT